MIEYVHASSGLFKDLAGIAALFGMLALDGLHEAFELASVEPVDRPEAAPCGGQARPRNPDERARQATPDASPPVIPRSPEG